MSIIRFIIQCKFDHFQIQPEKTSLLSKTSHDRVKLKIDETHHNIFKINNLNSTKLTTEVSALFSVCRPAAKTKKLTPLAEVSSPPGGNNWVRYTSLPLPFPNNLEIGEITN
jgi:hypothetical protein